MENWLDWTRHMWTTYVAGMNRQRQREIVYGPLGASVLDGGRRLLNAEWWRDAWQGLRDAFGALTSFFADGRWISWRGGLAILVALVLCYVGLRALRLALRTLPSFPGLAKGKRTRVDRQRVLAAFYGRLEALLARTGLVRSTCQTQREFATEAGARIAKATGQTQLAGVPVEIAEAFYRVRFGGIKLDGRETQAVERALGCLEEAVDGKPLLSDA
jgi:hypothetical protein